jgi:hypothetical protein
MKLFVTNLFLTKLIISIELLSIFSLGSVYCLTSLFGSFISKSINSGMFAILLISVIIS